MVFLRLQSLGSKLGHVLEFPRRRTDKCQRLRPAGPSGKQTRHSEQLRCQRCIQHGNLEATQVQRHSTEWSCSCRRSSKEIAQQAEAVRGKLESGHDGSTPATQATLGRLSPWSQRRNRSRVTYPSVKVKLHPHVSGRNSCPSSSS